MPHRTRTQGLASAEILWDEYAVSSRALENARTDTLSKRDAFLIGLGYLK